MGEHKINVSGLTNHFLRHDRPSSSIDGRCPNSQQQVRVKRIDGQKSEDVGDQLWQSSACVQVSPLVAPMYSLRMSEINSGKAVRVFK